MVKIHWKGDLGRRTEEGVRILSSLNWTLTFEQVVTKNAGGICAATRNLRKRKLREKSCDTHSNAKKVIA